MGDLRLPLTDKNVLGLPLATGGQYRARDMELAGFFVLVGARTKSFMIQADLRTKGQRQSIRMKVGGAGDMTTRDARAKAKGLLGIIASGVVRATSGGPSPNSPGSEKSQPCGKLGSATKNPIS